MNTRVLAATVAGGIVMFALGFLIYGLALDAYMKANMIQYTGLMKEPMPDMVPLFVSNLVLAGLFAYVFDAWAGVRDFAGGLKAGACMAFPLGLAVDLQFFSMMNLIRGFTPIIVDVIAFTVMMALVGSTIGIVLGAMGPKTAPQTVTM